MQVLCTCDVSHLVRGLRCDVVVVGFDRACWLDFVVEEASGKNAINNACPQFLG